MMQKECADALKREFGYVPDEDGGERWVVYRDHALIVMHPDRLIRIYDRGQGGDSFCEINPTPWR